MWFDMEIARALAAHLGVEVQLVGYPTPPTVEECLKAGACDVAIYGDQPISGRGGRLHASTCALSLHLSGAGWLLNPKCRRRGPARGSHRGRA